MLTSFTISYFDGRNGKISDNYKSYHQSFLNFHYKKKMYMKHPATFFLAQIKFSVYKFRNGNMNLILLTLIILPHHIRDLEGLSESGELTEHDEKQHLLQALK